MDNKNIGRLGERIAAKFLVDKGFSIITRNFALNRSFEIDIIAIKDKKIHFIEAKTLRGTEIDEYTHVVNNFKIAKLKRSLSKFFQIFPRFKGAEACVSVVFIHLKKNIKDKIAKVVFYQDID